MEEAPRWQIKPGARVFAGRADILSATGVPPDSQYNPFTKYPAEAIRKFLYTGDGGQDARCGRDGRAPGASRSILKTIPSQNVRPRLRYE
jgi:hypothetical protein